jgi:hypothetical protein
MDCRLGGIEGGVISSLAQQAISALGRQPARDIFVNRIDGDKLAWDWIELPRDSIRSPDSRNSLPAFIMTKWSCASVTASAPSAASSQNSPF